MLLGQDEIWVLPDGRLDPARQAARSSYSHTATTRPSVSHRPISRAPCRCWIGSRQRRKNS